MSTEELKDMGRVFFETQDKLKGKLSAEICARDYTASIAGNPPVDFEGHSQFGTLFYTGFPDLRHIIHDVFTDGEKVVVRFSLTGKHKGEFLGIPATQKTINVSAIAILHIVNNKVKEIYGEYNHFDLLKQLGVIPEMING